MKKTLLALAVAAATLSSFAQAQSPADDQVSRGNPLKQAVVASWHLDADQTRALAEADAEFRAQRQQLRDQRDEAASPQTHRQAMDELLEQQRTRLAQILDAEQQRAYLMLERPMPGQHGPERPRLDPERLTQDFEQRFTPLMESWNLDPASREQVVSAQRTFIEGLKAQHPQRTDKPGPREQGEDKGDRREARKAAFEQLLTQRHEALAEVLDADQLAAFEALTQPPRPMHHGEAGPAPTELPPSQG
ncbi:hypothetical protein [Halotalea alkalilenta]|uniref:LTXXQ motif family protein n=1 Tax=Halotalea alkalilenta TaxID=376489 RepID=A0A172YCX8_9GAMM|nr:hypothetical protein [Halotalea alkalilenta]ANF57109.1 hypothetical protein A5892_06220 [Halotalea alkalilenta]